MRFFHTGILSALCCASLSAEVVGIVGNGNAFLVDSSGNVAQVDVSSANILSVAINNSALSVVAGNLPDNYNYAALVNQFNLVTPFSNNGAFDLTLFFSTAINGSGNSVVAGGNSGTPFLVTADSVGNVGGPGNFGSSCGVSNTGTFLSSAINSSGWVVAGGNSGDNPTQGLYVVQLAPGASVADEVLCGGSNPARINGVDLNDSGQAVVGGMLHGSAYTSLFNVLNPGSVYQVNFPFSLGQILSVSINESGTSLIGGLDHNLAAYAAFVQPSGQLETALSPLPIFGRINSVDITDGFGYAIIGGKDLANGGSAYAAFVDSQGRVYPISGLPTGSGASINSVSMNELGIALIGGTDGTNPYAALVNPFSGLTQLDITGSAISSVSIRNFKSGFDFVKPHLTGNNLIFAKYILNYARKKALYFSPSLFNGTLAEALESAAPTRNALSVFAADNNLFSFNNGLSAHLNHLRQRRYWAAPTKKQMVVFEEEEEDDFSFEMVARPPRESTFLAMADDQEFELELISQDYEEQLAFQQDPALEELIEEEAPREAERPFSLWGEVIGAWASQKAQHQTVAFDPTSGGFIVAFEKSFHQKNQVGGGFSYMFTHVHEEHDAGSSNINQECLFVYGSWLFGRFYLDAALWGGLFQTDQERKIHMTGFDFKSISHPTGGQFDPHLELGYAIVSKQRAGSAWRLMLDPFVMVDWVNTWQGSYKEKGNSPFNAGQKSHYSSFLRTEAGFRFYESVRFDSWVLGLEQKTSYVFKKPYSVGTVQAFLVGSPGSFTVETLSSQGNLGLVELGILFNPINRSKPYGSISYQGEFSDAYKSQQLTLELCWDF